MAPASSSAMRDETAFNDAAYGSLSGLGGPKVFKKKPVLVLDPEELEAAHALFHEGAATLVSDEVEQAPRPARVLGLAPMDDHDDEADDTVDPDDIVDEDAEEEDDTPIDAAAVLSLTRSRSTAYTMEEYFGEDELAEEAEFSPAAYDPDALPQPDDAIDDGLDLSKRIFPKLPIQSEPQDAPVETDDDVAIPVEDLADDLPMVANQKDVVTPGFTGLSIEPEPEGAQQEKPEREEQVDEPSDEAVEDHDPASDADFPQPTFDAGKEIPLDAKLSDFASLELVDDELDAVEHTAAPANLAEPEPPVEINDIAPSQPPAATGEPKPARFDEVNPARIAEDEDAFDLEAWLSEEQAEPVISTGKTYYSYPPEPEPEPEPEPDPTVQPEAAADEDETSNVTYTGDDTVDGYAFMRTDPRSRGMPVPPTQAGSGNSLRARFKQPEAEAPPVATPAEEPTDSILGRFGMALRKWFS